jgi:glycosyltransferase involved in cell wall biosynthesis
VALDMSGIRLLTVTNLFPAEDDPTYGTFVAEQVEALRAHPGISLVDVLFIDGRKDRLAYARAVPEVRRRAKSRTYDLIHAHHGLAGAVAVCQRRLPVVVTYHSGDIDYFPWQRRISRVVARRTARNICVARRDIRRLGRPATHIPCGLDTTRFAPHERGAARHDFGVPEGSLALLFPSSRDRRKKMYSRFEEVREELEARGHPVHELRLEKVPRERVPELLAASDVMVMTSVSEGAPVAVMEALSAGLPVVSTPVGEVEAMIGDVANCRVDEFDAQRFADAVESLSQDGPRAPASRSEDYSQERVVAALVDVYRDVLERC